MQDDDLAEVCAASDCWGADVFLSIHCNASYSRDARGAETWYKSFHGQRLANCIQSQMVRSIQGVIARGVKQSDNLYVLNATDAVAALAELVFIDNMDDLALLKEKMDAFARALARGVTDFDLG